VSRAGAPRFASSPQHWPAARLVLLAASLLLGPRAAASHDESSRRAPDLVAPHLLPSQPPAARSAAAGNRYYIGNDDHTDYMWSGDDNTYRLAFGRMLDYYMTQAETTSTYPADAQGRFNCDGSVWVSEYERTHTGAQFDRLVSHLRDGSITMPLNTLVQLYGAMPAEAVLRSFYYAGRLERREGLRFPMVIPMEDQTLPGGVASLWAGAGASYAWKGICACNTPVNVTSRPRAIYRFTGPDGRSVLMKWQPFSTNQSLGGYAEARDPVAAVDKMRHDPTFLSYWPWPVAAAFGYGWDDLQTTTDAFVHASLQLSDTSSRVIVSNEVDFFQDFEATSGASLQSYGASFGNDWDLLPAAMGEVTAAVKRSVEKLRTAEALATIASIADPSFMSSRTSARDSAMMACGLYYDHSWGPGPGVTESQRAAWQRRMQQAITGYVDRLHADGLARLGALVHAAPGAERHVVFNPLSWSRSDVVDLTVSTPAPLHVVDVATAQEVPSQAVVVDGQARVRILASDVPSVGYRVYEIRAGAGASFPASVTVSLPTMDNTVYGVTVGGHGQITSLLDHKDAGRQLVGAGALNDLGSGAGTATVENAGPVSTTLRVVAGGTPAHETRVTMFAAGLDRLEVESRITQNFGDTEAYRFAFDLPGMTMRHEEVGMIARVGRLAAGGDYADEDTRTDYLTLNHFVDLSQATRGVTLSSWDSGYFQAGNSTTTFLDAATATVRCVVGMPGSAPTMTNQNGDSFFLDRFALRTHGAYDPAAAMRFALEHQNPLVATRVTGEAGSLPATMWSLLTIDSPDVLLWALKPAEEGISQGGVIARVWNLAEGTRAMALTLPPYGIAYPRHVTHIETDLRAATLAGGAMLDTLQRQQMETYRLQLAATVDTTPDGPPPGLAFSAFPNPLARGAAATVAYTMPRPGLVRLEVFDVTGATVATLSDGWQTAGTHLTSWDGRRGGGGDLGAGVYFVRIRAAGATRTIKLVTLR
jgi:alpha-mannosidase